MKSKLTLILGLLIGYSCFAQNQVTVQNGNLRAFMTPLGLNNNNADPLFSYYDISDETYKSVAYAANIWMSHTDSDGNIDIHAPTFGNGLESNNLLPKVFQVNGYIISNHIADFEEDGVIDNPQDEIYAWPGRGNPHFADYNDGLELPEDAQVLAPFWDQNGDGLYNPEDGDFPMLAIQGCELPLEFAIIPTQMNWCIYDVKSIIDPDEPLYHVLTNMFYFNCEEDNYLTNTIFTHHTVVNKSTSPLENSYWSMWADLDIGNASDDYVGSFPERFASYVYNADNDDKSDDNVIGFGQNPPVFGFDIFKGPWNQQGEFAPISSIMHYYNGGLGGFPPGTTDPSTPQEYYNYMQGRWRDGQPLTEGQLGYQQAEPTNFGFPGLPNQENAWTEWEAQNPLGDRRSLISFGPFTNLPGAVNEMITAFSFYDDESNHLDKVDDFRTRLDQVQAFYDNCMDIDGIGFPSCNLILTSTQEAELNPTDFKVYPNPTSGQLTIESLLAIDQVQLLNTQGQEVLQTPQTQLDVSHLPKGIYYLRLKVANQFTYKKIIISN